MLKLLNNTLLSGLQESMTSSGPGEHSNLQRASDSDLSQIFPCWYQTGLDYGLVDSFVFWHIFFSPNLVLTMMLQKPLKQMQGKRHQGSASRCFKHNLYGCSNQSFLLSKCAQLKNCVKKVFQIIMD